MLAFWVSIESERRRHGVSRAEPARIANPISHHPAQSQRKRSNFVFRKNKLSKLELAQRECQSARAEKRATARCALSTVRRFPSNVPDLEKSSTLATTSSKHEDDDRNGKHRTSSNDAKKIRETPDPVVARCQMPTSENMYSYPASSFAR